MGGGRWAVGLSIRILPALKEEIKSRCYGLQSRFGGRRGSSSPAHMDSLFLLISFFEM